eukprot:COSAG02_NODE_718_length_18064_cov_5.507932_4_plen_922_part_00
MNSVEFSYAVNVSQYDEPEDEATYYRRSRLAFVDDHTAATHLQAAFRAHTARRWMRSWRRAATKIQNMWRLVKKQQEQRADVASGRASLLDRARSIGINTEHELPLLFVAEQLAMAQLPDGWVEYLDDDGVRFFYFHEASQDSTYEHPLAPKYKQLVLEARRRMQSSDAWKVEQRRLESVAEAEEEARQAQVAAIRAAVQYKCEQYARRRAEAEAEVRRIAATEAAAATRIQAVWRARRPRHETQVRLINKRAKDRIRAVGEARRAQAAARALRLSEIVATEERTRSAARLHAARLRHGLKVQALARGRACRRQLAAERAGAIVLQAAWRGRQSRVHVAEAQQAATSVQAVMRGRWARRDLAAQRHKEQSKAALIMQTSFRGWQARAERQNRLKWILKLQGIWRGKALRTELAELRAAAATVQARWRGHRVRLHKEIEHRSALMVQARWRGKLVRAAQHRDLSAAVLVQAGWRGRVGRARGRRETRAAAQVRRIYDKYDSNGLGVLGKPELQRISKDAHALGGRDCGLDMVAWRLLCTKVASEVAAAGGSNRVGITQRGFRWAVRPAGGNDANFEYDKCVAVYAWQSEQRRDLTFAVGARIAITSRSVPGNGWWTGHLIGTTERGSFPANYVKELPQQAHQDLDHYERYAMDDSSLLRGLGQSMDNDQASSESVEAERANPDNSSTLGMQGRKFGYGGSASMMPLSKPIVPTDVGRHKTIAVSKLRSAQASSVQKERLIALAETVPPITTTHDLGKLHRTLFSAELRQEAAICIQRHWRGVALRVFILPFDAVARKLQAAFRARLEVKHRKEFIAAVQIQRVVRGRRGRAQAEATRQLHVLESMNAALRAQQAAVRKSQRRAAKREKRHKQAAAAARLHNGDIGEERHLDAAGRRIRTHTVSMQAHTGAKHEQSRLLDNYG